MRSGVLKIIRKRFLLLFIALIALGSRITQVDRLPPSLNWDEVSHGYNAYSILTTGKDEWGFVLPSIFRAYGDYKLPVYIYLTSLSVLLFGLSPFAVRLPSVLAGVGTVVFTYFLVLELYSREKIKESKIDREILAAVSSFLVAVEPWSLFASRAAFEANLSLFFIVSGVYFFLKGFQKPSHFLLSSLFLGLSVWTYNSARIFVPILILVLFLIYWKDLVKVFKKDKKLSFYCLLVTAFFFVPMFYQLLTPVGRVRFSKVAILDSGAISQIIESRQSSDLNPFLTRLLYNRPTYFIQNFISNWAKHFTCSFLFFKGGTHYQFSLPGHGLLYLINLPFFFIGWLVLLKQSFKKDRVSLFLLTWLFLAAIPSSLTREAPHVLRSIVMLPIPMVATAIGLMSFVSWLERRKLNIARKFFLIFYILILFVFIGNYLNKYFTEYRRVFSWAWQYGYKETVDYLKGNYGKYDKIIFTKKYGEPHEFILFYWRWRPRDYINDERLVRFYQSEWYWVDRFDKFYFVNDWDIPKEGQLFVLESGETLECTRDVRCILVTSPGNFPKTWKHLKTVNFLDGQPAFEIYEN